MIDRESPRKRPSEEPIGYQNWRELLFLHWSVDPADLIKLIPPELELDLWRGEALVGVVPFRMEGVRPWWAPKAFGFNFLETNLRIYVLHKGEPGVFFFSLDAESHIAVQAAKLGWSLPYYYAQMSTSDQDGLIQYQTQRPSSSLPDLEVSYRRGSPINPIEPDSLEFFLLERYVLFTVKKGGILRGQVHHSPYPVQEAEVLDVQHRLLDHIHLPVLNSRLYCAHYSPGVNVEIFPLRRCLP